MKVEHFESILRARQEFPSVTAPGAPVFFDNPGGTQVPHQVAEAISYYLTHNNANSHGAFENSKKTDALVEDARQAMADFLGANSHEEIVFGPNMTTLTFSISRALGRILQPGDEIVVTTLDHDANVAPWLLLAEDKGLTIRTVDINPEDCTLSVDSLHGAVSPRTRIIAVTYASNAVGTIVDVQNITRIGHEVGALVFIDAVHYAAHGPIDVTAIGCDVLACSAYKFFGPHVGVLYIRRDLSEMLRPYKVRPASNKPPYKWETGTPSYELLAGITPAVDHIASLGSGNTRRERILSAMHTIQEYEAYIGKPLLEGLLSLPVNIYGIRDLNRWHERVATFAFRCESIHPRNMAQMLAERGFNVWDGNYYALSLMQRLGLEDSGGAVRIGLAHYNTREEVDRFLNALEDIVVGSGV